MRRMLVLAAAAICFAGAAHAQTSGSSKHQKWSDGNQSCMEPYAPAVPKPEETTLQKLVEEVKPEILSFIEQSNKYLDCLAVQMVQAKEAEDEERLAKLVKAHNENVDYQKAVAAEFNAALEALNERDGMPKESSAAGENDAAPEKPAETPAGTTGSNSQ